MLRLLFHAGKCCCVQVLHDMIMPLTDSGAAVGDAIVSFGAVAVLAPRGRFEIELYGSFMKLLGQVRHQHLCWAASVFPKAHVSM